MVRKGILVIVLFCLAILLLPVLYPTIIEYINEEILIARYFVFFIIKILLIGIGLYTLVKWMRQSESGQTFLYSSLIMGILLSISFFVYHNTEERLKKNGMKPGILFAGYDYSDTLVVDQYVISDKDGINRFGRPMPWLKERQLNAQGFISPFNFDSISMDSLRKTGKNIVSLLGDSFLEGVSEDLHVDSTFLELIRIQHPKWALASFGVGGTGPPDYARCAEMYLSIIQPNLVVVIFYAGNDIMEYDIPATPGIPNFWHTNCGWLESTVEYEFTGGDYLVLETPEKAYVYYRDRFTLFGENNFKSRYFRQSRVLTSLYCNLFNEPKTFPVSIDSNITYSYLKKIHSRAENVGSRFLIAVIPDMNKLEVTLPENHHMYNWVFKDLSRYAYIPTDLSHEDYMKDNRHFNDSGNRKFSFFLATLIRDELNKKTQDTPDTLKKPT